MPYADVDKQKEYNKANKERIKEYRKQYTEKNREKINEYQRLYMRTYNKNK